MKTIATIEIANVAESLAMLWHTANRNLLREDWIVLWPVLLAVVVLVARLLVRRVADDRIRPIDVMVCACVAGAIGNAIGVSLPDWTRLNDYPFRYLVPTMALLIVGTALVATSVVASLVDRVSAPTRAAATVAALTAVIWMIPPRQDATALEELERTARGLVSIDAPVVVFGTYWESYIWQALNPSVLAVPLEGQWTRTPNTRVALPTYRTAFLCTNQPLAPPALRQFQLSWERTERPVFESPRCRFFEYRRTD